MAACSSTCQRISTTGLVGQLSTFPTIFSKRSEARSAERWGKAERRLGALLRDMEKAKGNAGARRRGLDLQADRLSVDRSEDVDRSPPIGAIAVR